MENEEVEKNQQTPKTYTEEEVTAIREQINADNQKAWDNRWGKEKSKMERNYARENQKKDEALNLIMEQTGVKSIDDLLDVSYKQYNVERPKTQLSQEDEETLGISDANKILGYSDEEIEQEAERLANLERTAREEATFMKIGAYLSDKKQKEKIKNEFKENGLDEGLLDDEDFKKFQAKFNKETPIKDVYELYQTTHPKKTPYNEGSLKDNVNVNDNEFFTQEEFMALTDKDLKNPKIYEKAMRSRFNF